MPGGYITTGCDGLNWGAPGSLAAMPLLGPMPHAASTLSVSGTPAPWQAHAQPLLHQQVRGPVVCLQETGLLCLTRGRGLLGASGIGAREGYWGQRYWGCRAQQVGQSRHAPAATGSYAIADRLCGKSTPARCE